MKLCFLLIRSFCLLGILALFSYSAVGQDCPTPSFTTTIDCDTVVFTIDTLLDNTFYVFDFGDGTTDTVTSKITTYRYNSLGNSIIDYDVKLIVSDSTCIDSLIQTIEVSQVPDVNVVDADENALGNSLNFTHCNRNYDLLRLRNTSTTISTNATYIIDWGDEVIETFSKEEFDTEIIQHQYADPGAYFVRVQIIGDNGCDATKIFPFLWGANPSIGLAIASEPSQCSPATIPFQIINYQNNTPGTRYVITVSDGTVYNFTQEDIPEIFEHTFETSSCGVNTDNFENAFSVRIDALVEIDNGDGEPLQSCGNATATVEPVRINTPPTSGFEVAPMTTQCQEDTFNIIGTSNPGIFYEIDIDQCLEIIRAEWTIFPSDPDNYTITRGSLTDPDGFSAVFHTPGNYNIRLTTQHASFSPVCNIDTIIRSICVVPTPEADIVLSSLGNGCTGSIFEVNDSSNVWESCDTSQTYNFWSIYRIDSDCEAGVMPMIDTIFTDNPINRQFQFNTSGEYGIVLTTVNQCGRDSDTTFVTIAKAPEVEITPFTGGIICDGTSVEFEIASFSSCNFSDTIFYRWEFENASIDTFESIGDLPPPVEFLYDPSDPNKIQTRTIRLITTSTCGTAIDSIQIQVAASPPPPVPIANEPCVGQGLELCIASDTSRLVFNWSKPGSSFTSTEACPIIPNATLADAGVYILVITDIDSGCSNDATVNVTVNPLPPVRIIPDQAEICIGDSQTFRAAGAVDYTWIDDNGTLNTLTGDEVIATVASPLAIRNYRYIVIGTDSLGCVNRDTTVLVVHPLPVVNAGSDTAVCANDVLRLNEATPVGGIWSGDGVNSNGDFVQDSAGVYTLYYEFTDSNGCTNLDSLEVCVLARPEAVFTVDTMNGCVGETGFIVRAVNTSLNLMDCRPAIYDWDILFNGAECHSIETGGEVIFSDPVQPVFRFTQSGQYTIRLRVRHELCSGFDEFSQDIVVGERPRAAITNLPNICELPDGTAIQNPMAVVLDCEQGPSTYLWDFLGGTPSSATSLNPGQIIYNTANGLIYPVQLAVTNVCGTTIVRDTFRILELVEADAVIDTFGCAPFTLTPDNLSRGSDLEYEWTLRYNGIITNTSTEFEPDFLLTQIGWHEVNLMTFSPCDTVFWQDSIFISEAPNFDLEPSETICVDETINLDNYIEFFNRSLIDSVFWDIEDGNVVDVNAFFPSVVTFDAGATGQKNIILTAFNGCTTITDTLVVQINMPLVADFELPDFACLPIMLSPEDNSLGDNRGYNWLFQDIMGNLVDSNFVSIQDGNTDTPKFTFNRTGTYVLTLTLANGICPSSTHRDTIFISEPPQFSINTDFPDLYCSGDSIYLNNPDAPYLFFRNRELIDSVQWCIAGFPDFTGFERGTIAFPPDVFGPQTVTIKAFNGCDTVILTDELTILEPLDADFELSQQFICQPDTVFITDLSTGDLRNYSYTATTIDGFAVDTLDIRFDTATIAEPRIIINRTGTYVICLTISNPFCAPSTHCDTIVVSELPRVDLEDYNLPFCAGDSIPIDVAYGNIDLIDEVVFTVDGEVISTEFFPGGFRLPSNRFGQFTVEVTVTNDCGTVTDAAVVTIFEPLTADFELETELACTSDTICVIDRSTGDDRNYFWRVETLEGFAVPATDFETFLSADSIQKFTFNEPGIYVVSLELRNTTCPSSTIIRDTIDISESPSFTFTLSDTLICSGTEFEIRSFYDNLELIDSVVWVIEDILETTTFDPILVNTTGINGRKRITATAYNRCEVMTITQFIDIYEPIVPSFELTTDAVCLNIEPTLIASSTSTGDSLQYLWATSSPTAVIADPMAATTAITFDTLGTYTITLTVFNDVCGTETVEQTVVVGDAPVAQLDPLSDFCERGSITPSVTYLNQAEVGLDSVRWTFEGSDTPTSTELFPTNIQYDAPGEYVVCLTMFNSCATITICDTFQILVPLEANATVDTFDCLIAGTTTIQAINRSIGDRQNVTWSIEPNTATIADPTADTTDVIFNSVGVYILRLQVSNDLCVASFWQDTIVINEAPTIAIDPVMDDCEETTVLLRATFTPDTTFIDNIQWFTRGMPNLSNSFMPNSVQFVGGGTYTIGATVTNGCGTTTDEELFQIDTIPVITFSPAARDTFCADDGVITLDSPTPSGGVWSGSGIVNGNLGTIDLGGLGSGTREITLTYTFINGACTASTERTIYIFDLSFVDAGEDLSACADEERILLTGGFPEGGQYSGTSVIEENGLFYFNPRVGAGTYPITYTYEQALTGCVGTDMLEFTVHPLPEPVITGLDQLCINTLETFGNETIFGDTYEWIISKSGAQLYTDTTFEANYTFPDTGTYLIQLTAISPFGCDSTITQRVFVSAPPVARYAVIPQRACDSLTPIFINQSVGYADPNFTWNYLSNSFTGETLSNVQFRANMGNTVYPVQLIVQNGCGTSSYLDSVEVLSSPIPDFQVVQSNTCSPATISFNNNTVGAADEFEWTITSNLRGFVTSFTEAQPTIQVLTADNLQNETYTITLTARNECGVQTISKTIVVKPSRLNPLFTLNQPSGCEPLLINPRNGMTLDSTMSYRWTVCDDITNNCTTYEAFNPSFELDAKENSLTTYTITLFADNNCVTDSTFATVQVFPKPQLSFEVVAPVLCSRDTLQFINTSLNNLGCIEYDFGDGSPTSNTLNPMHVYSSPGTYTITLTACDNTTGCVDTFSRMIVVNQKPQARLEVPDTTGCPGLEVRFRNRANGASFFIYDFGDGDSTNTTMNNFTHTYTRTGNYSVTQIAISDEGCVDHVTAGNITIHPVPVAGFQVPMQGDCVAADTICLTNTSTGAVSYQWFRDSVLVSTATIPCLDYQETMTNTIGLITQNEFGCTDRTEQDFTIYIQPVADFSPLDTTICAGDAILFRNLSTSYNFSYWYVNGILVDSVTNLNYIFDTPGEYSVGLEVGNNIGCLDFVEIGNSIRVTENPSADFEYTFLAGEPIFTYQFTSQFKGDVLNFYWDFGDGNIVTDPNPIHRFPLGVPEYEVTLVVEDGVGCTYTVTKTIVVKDIVNLYIPNILEPDSDIAEERVFFPKGIGLAAYHIIVYARNGQVVWESTAFDANGSPTESWDGTYLGNGGELLPAGTYVWEVRLARFVNQANWGGMAEESGEKRRTGFVSLLR